MLSGIKDTSKVLLGVQKRRFLVALGQGEQGRRWRGMGRIKRDFLKEVAFALVLKR